MERSKDGAAAFEQLCPHHTELSFAFFAFCSVLQLLQCVTVYCSVCCSVWHCVDIHEIRIVLQCSVLQYVTVCWTHDV